MEAAAYRKANPDKIREAKKWWCDTHREHVKDYQRKYVEAHRSEINAYQRERLQGKRISKRGYPEPDAGAAVRIITEKTAIKRILIYLADHPEVNEFTDKMDQIARGTGLSADLVEHLVMEDAVKYGQAKKSYIIYGDGGYNTRYEIMKVNA